MTRNDSKDRDVGANQRLNFPERLVATDNGTATMVEGRIDFPDPPSLTIELFANEAPDPSGHGDGETFVATATPEANGRFTATLPAGLAGQWLPPRSPTRPATRPSSPRPSRSPFRSDSPVTGGATLGLVQM